VWEADAKTAASGIRAPIIDHFPVVRQTAWDAKNSLAGQWDHLANAGGHCLIQSLASRYDFAVQHHPILTARIVHHQTHALDPTMPPGYVRHLLRMHELMVVF
jgi:hypothetical protein